MQRSSSEYGRIELRNANSRSHWENEWYTELEVFPLQERLFGDMYLSMSANLMPFLHRTYGKDCLSVGKTHTYDHLTRSSMQSKVVDHTKTGTSEFVPARPFC